MPVSMRAKHQNHVTHVAPRAWEEMGLPRSVAGMDVKRPKPEVSLPKVALPDEIEDDRPSFAELRILREGSDAWEGVKGGQSFLAWKKIGRALLLLRNQSLAEIGSEVANGKRYAVAMSRRCKAAGFGSMRPATRSVCIELSENIQEIERWRASAPKERREAIHPLSVVRKWRQSQAPQGPRAVALEHYLRTFCNAAALIDPKSAALDRGLLMAARCWIDAVLSTAR